jgi:hypothetical protein
MRCTMVRALIVMTVLIVVTIGSSETAAFAQGYARQWGFGVELGALFDTVDKTVFTVGGNADYFVDETVSIGTMVQVAPGTDFTQVNGWAVAKLHFKNKYIDIAPFTGPGATWARVAEGRLSPKNQDDASWSMVFGVEIGLGKIGKYAVAGTAMYNVYKIKLAEQTDKGSWGLMVGVRF